MSAGISQGRLTLQSGFPLQQTDAVNVGTIFYAAYKGANINIGGVMYLLNGEASLVLGNYVTAGNIHGVFWTLDGTGTPVLCVGPAWSTPPNIGITPGIESAAGATASYYPYGGITVNTNSSPMTCMYGAGAGTSVSAPQYQATMVGLIYATGTAAITVQIQPAAVVYGSHPVMGMCNLDWPEWVTIFESDLNSAISDNQSVVENEDFSQFNEIFFVQCRNPGQATAVFDASQAWQPSGGSQALTIGIGWNLPITVASFSGAAGHGAVLGQVANTSAGAGSQLYGQYNAFPNYGLSRVTPKCKAHRFLPNCSWMISAR